MYNRELVNDVLAWKKLIHAAIYLGSLRRDGDAAAIDLLNHRTDVLEHCIVPSICGQIEAAIRRGEEVNPEWNTQSL